MRSYERHWSRTAATWFRGSVPPVALRSPGGKRIYDDIITFTTTERRNGATITRTAVEPVAGSVVDRLVSDGRLGRDGAIVRLPGTASAAATPDPVLVAAMERLEGALSIPAPPALSDAARASVCPPAGVRELERTGRIVILEPDLAYATATYRDLVATAVAMARDRPLTPAALRDATGTSRKYVMAILADLDRQAILRRTPAGHVPGSRAP